MHAGEYDHVDKYVLSQTNFDDKDILRLTYQLTHRFEKTEEKVRAVYFWITANIKYDTNLLRDKSKIARTYQEVLDRKKDVCNGYAMLFKAMMDKIGIECEIISGYSKGYNYEIGNVFNENNSHAWNAVKINNEWKLIDATWGAGFVEEDQFISSFNDYYFFTPPEQLIQTHYPRQKNWQLLQNKVHRDEFENSVFLKSHFFKYKVKIISHTKYIINTDNFLQIVFEAPQDIQIEAQIIFNITDLDKRFVFTQRENDLIRINAVFPYAETYTLRLFAKRKDEILPFKWILDYRVIVNKDADERSGFPEKYAEYDQYNTYLFYPLTKFLKPGKEIIFKLSVQNCEKVALIHGDSFNFFKQNGDIFEGKFIIPNGKFYIAANMPGSNKFAYLLEFYGWK
jgi:hypothetical protein